MTETLRNYLDQHAKRAAAAAFVPWGDLEQSTIVVTGATGLIGSQLARTLVAADALHGLGLKLALPVRNVEKARNMGLDALSSAVDIQSWRAGEPFKPGQKIDYVIHSASPTASAEFVDHPVETIGAIVDGGKAVLECARAAGARRALFLSTMEIYGATDAPRLDESTFGAIDPISARNSYPEAKRLMECLFAAYAHEYGLHTIVLRPAQTFGVGVAREEKRVFAEFARCALAGRDIVLQTDGAKRNPYLSVDDAMTAILVVLLKGEAGRAYNAANEETYCSIREMAHFVLETYGSPGAQVVIAGDSSHSGLYPSQPDLRLDCARLRELGWAAHDSLPDMYRAMMETWRLGEP